MLSGRPVRQGCTLSSVMCLDTIIEVREGFEEGVRPGNETLDVHSC